MHLVTLCMKLISFIYLCIRYLQVNILLSLCNSECCMFTFKWKAPYVFCSILTESWVFSLFCFWYMLYTFHSPSGERQCVAHFSQKWKSWYTADCNETKSFVCVLTRGKLYNVTKSSVWVIDTSHIFQTCFQTGKSNDISAFTFSILN